MKCIQRGQATASDAFGRLYMWNVQRPTAESDTYAYCVSRAYGLLPIVTVYDVDEMYPLMNWAAEQGDVDPLDSFQVHLAVAQTLSGEAVDRAATHGHLGVLQWIQERDPTRIQQQVASALPLSVTHGHVQVAQWLFAHSGGTKHKYPISERRSALGNGYFDVVQWLDMAFPDDHDDLNRTENSGTDPLAIASYQGRLDVVKKLLELHDFTITLQLITEFAYRGHVEVVRFFVSRLAALGDRITDFPPVEVHYGLVGSAAASGDLKLVQWLVGDLGLWSAHAIYRAASDNRVQILVYLHRMAQTRADPEGVVVTAIANYDMDLPRLIQSGHLGSVDWVLDNVADLVFPHQDWAKFEFFLTMERYHAYDQATLHVMTQERNMTRPFEWTLVVNKLHIRIIKTLRRLWLAAPASACLLLHWLPRWAIKTNSLVVLQRLAAINHAHVFTRRALHLLLSTAKRDGHGIVQWFLDHEDAAAVVDTHKASIMKWAAQYQCLDLVERVLSRYPQDLACLRTAVWTGAKNGHVDVLVTVARALAMTSQDTIAPTDRLACHAWRNAAKIAAECGHVTVIDWLWSRGLCGLDKLADIASKHGRLAVLQWLHKHHPNEHDVGAGVDVSGMKAGCSIHGLHAAVGNGHVGVDDEPSSKSLAPRPPAKSKSPTRD